MSVHDPVAPSGTDLGRACVAAVADADFGRLEGLLATDVRFRALTPSRALEASSASEARRIIEGWFGDTSERVLLASDVEELADRLIVVFRMRLREDGADLVVEQHLVARVEDGVLADVALVCSGFRPAAAASVQILADPAPSSPAQPDSAPAVPAGGPGRRADARFDAIGLSCATLTPAIRSAVVALRPGQVLEIVSDDPSAREGLRSWTRLTGHELLGDEPVAGAAAFYIRRSGASAQPPREA